MGMFSLINVLLIIQNLILRVIELMFTFRYIYHIPSLFTSLLLLTFNLPFLNVFKWLKDVLSSKQKKLVHLLAASVLFFLKGIF